MSTAPISGLSRLTIVSLVAVGLAILWTMWLEGAVILPGVAVAMVPLMLAGLVATRVGWMPALAGLVAALYCWEALQALAVMLRLANAADIFSRPEIVAHLVRLVGSASAAVAGIGATAQHYWPSGRRA